MRGKRADSSGPANLFHSLWTEFSLVISYMDPTFMAEMVNVRPWGPNTALCGPWDSSLSHTPHQPCFSPSLNVFAWLAFVLHLGSLILPTKWKIDKDYVNLYRDSLALKGENSFLHPLLAPPSIRMWPLNDCSEGMWPLK